MIDLDKYPINDMLYQKWEQLLRPDTDLLKEIPLLLEKRDPLSICFKNYLIIVLFLL